jgi:hypothetical protein
MSVDKIFLKSGICVRVFQFAGFVPVLLGGRVDGRIEAIGRGWNVRIQPEIKSGAGAALLQSGHEPS